MNGLRYAIRSLRGARLYTITVVSVLGFGAVRYADSLLYRVGAYDPVV
jgi:hypothetical protein